MLKNFLLFGLFYALSWKFYYLFSKFVYISLVDRMVIGYTRYALFNWQLKSPVKTGLSMLP